MKISVDVMAIRETRWYQLAVRFCIGGLITAATGIVARRYGPSVAGLFLAFPAIFPASATLIEKHEQQERQEAGVEGTRRARQAVSIDAAGAALGSIGLFAFALVVTEFVEHFPPSFVIAGATAIWAAVSIFLWRIRKEA